MNSRLVSAGCVLSTKWGLASQPESRLLRICMVSRRSNDLAPEQAALSMRSVHRREATTRATWSVYAVAVSSPGDS